MIGQKNLIKLIDNISTDCTSRLFIIIGEKGSGKKLIAKRIVKNLNANLSEVDNKIDSVRYCIETAYKQNDQTCYCFYDVDKMSIGAKNSLLKVTEEPPNKAYFILTVTSDQFLPKTLLSRGMVFRIENYTKDELIDYYVNIKLKKERLDEVIYLCNTPGDIELMIENSVVDFINFIYLVYENIAEVSGANAFKITNRIKIKDDDKGFDSYLFLKCMKKMFLKSVNKSMIEAWRVTEKSFHDLTLTGINKSFLIDRWILDVRDCFYSEE